MSSEKELYARSDSSCELCRSTSDLKIYEVAPEPSESIDNQVLICSNCIEQMEDGDKRLS